MAKTDYTKMENLLTEGLLKMSMAELWDLADKTTSFKDPQSDQALPSVQARGILISFMLTDLNALVKLEGIDMERVGITSKDLKNLQGKLKEISEEEWQKIKKIRENLAAYKLELKDKIPHLTDEELIELERRKHINKRYNVRDKWLPLH